MPTIPQLLGVTGRRRETLAGGRKKVLSPTKDRDMQREQLKRIKSKAKQRGQKGRLKSLLKQRRD